MESISFKINTEENTGNTYVPSNKNMNNLNLDIIDPYMPGNCRDNTMLMKLVVHISNNPLDKDAMEGFFNLIENKNNLNNINSNGWTALTYAVAYSVDLEAEILNNNIEPFSIVRILLNAGASPNIFGKDSLTPLMVASQMCGVLATFDAFNALLEYGAKETINALYIGESCEYGMSAFESIFSSSSDYDNENAEAFDKSDMDFNKMMKLFSDHTTKNHHYKYIYVEELVKYYMIVMQKLIDNGANIHRKIKNFTLLSCYLNEKHINFEKARMIIDNLSQLDLTPDDLYKYGIFIIQHNTQNHIEILKLLLAKIKDIETYVNLYIYAIYANNIMISEIIKNNVPSENIDEYNNLVDEVNSNFNVTSFISYIKKKISNGEIDKINKNKNLILSAIKIYNKDNNCKPKIIIEFLKFLIKENNIQIDAMGKKDNMTAMAYSCINMSKKMKPITKYLLKKKANPNHRSYQNMTPLMALALTPCNENNKPIGENNTKLRAKMAKKLIKFGADIDATVMHDNLELKAITIAYITKKTLLVEFLFNYKERMNAKLSGNISEKALECAEKLRNNGIMAWAEEIPPWWIPIIEKEEERRRLAREENIRKMSIFEE